MPPVLGAVGEPAEPPSEVSIHITVPVEFADMSLAGLNSRRGLITGMDVQTGTVLIRDFATTTEPYSLARSQVCTVGRLRRPSIGFAQSTQ